MVKSFFSSIGIDTNEFTWFKRIHWFRYNDLYILAGDIVDTGSLGIDRLTKTYTGLWIGFIRNGRFYPSPTIMEYIYKAIRQQSLLMR